MFRRNVCYLIVFFVAVFSTRSFAQTVNWAFSTGGTGDEGTALDAGSRLHRDNLGNVYHGGMFASPTIDVDPSAGTVLLTNIGGRDAYIAKYSSTGAFLQVIHFGGLENEGIKNLATDAAGNIYVTGFFNGTTDFDPSPATYNVTATCPILAVTGYFFVAKYNAAGQFQWVNTFGGNSGYDYGDGLAVSPDGTVYVGGIVNMSGNIDVDPSAGVFNLQPANGNAFCIKYTTNGQLVNAFNIGGGLQNSCVRDIKLESDGSLYMAGYIKGNCDIDPTAGVHTITSNSEDPFLIRLDTNFNFSWGFNIRTDNQVDEGFWIALDANNAYITGYVRGPNIDLDPSSAVTAFNAAGGNDQFIASYDKGGQYRWGHVIGAAGNDVGWGISHWGKDLYVCGYFNSTVDFDPGAATANLTSNGSRDIYVAKFDTNGVFNCVFQSGSVGNDGAYSVLAYGPNKFLVDGAFHNNITLPQGGTSLSSNGAYDLFLADITWSCTPPPTTINDYGAVLSFTECKNELSLDDASPFGIGDTILVVQMKGAIVDTTNTASFGNVLDYNGAGNYEFNVIESIAGNTVTLAYKLQRYYDFAKGKVQLVTVPSYQNYVVDAPLTCMPWDGNKGGVFVMNVANTLTLNEKIDVSGNGFRGGQSNGGTTYSCDFTDHFYPEASNNGGIKGEGFTTVGSDKMRGKGKLGNGGGGGNNTNAGGGGGSNGGVGGTGGHQWEGCNMALLSGGIAGQAPVYSPAANTVFLGGGGGAGHENNADTDDGGNGGGIVIIIAGTITGLDSIVADGNDCVGLNAGPVGDGQSGGGAGGTILLDANAVTGAPKLLARGGNGGNVLSTGVHGPGGGAGGGAVLFAGATVPSSQIDVSAGVNGFNLGSNAHFALPGQDGVNISNYTVPMPLDSFQMDFDIDFADSVISCDTRQFLDRTTPAGAIVSWSWDFGDGGTSTLQDPLHTYAATGTYTVTLIATDSTGCSDTLAKQVALQTLSYSISDSLVDCKTLEFTAVHDSGNIAAIAWSFGDGDTLSGNPVIHNYATGGSYAVELIVTDTLGCRDTISTGIFVDDVDADISVADDTICQGAIVTFINSSSANSIFYGWTFGDGAVDSSVSPVHQYPNAGVYIAQLVVGNTSQCIDSAQVVITVDSIATVDFVTSDSILCEGRQVVFDAAYFGLDAGVGFDWDFGGATVSGQTPAVYAFDTSGIFPVSLTVHFRACPDAFITKNIAITPFPRLDLGPDTAMCPGSSAIVLSDGINAFTPNATWLWNTGETTSSIAARTPGIYTLNVNLDGCSTDDSIEVFKDCYLDIPNVFSPNGDGMNDYFIPRQLLSAGLVAFRMTIFNRWGQPIFETNKTDGRGWDGRFNDKEQPVGVYVYLIDAVFKNGGAEHYQGNVTLLR